MARISARKKVEQWSHRREAKRCDVSTSRNEPAPLRSEMRKENVVLVATAAASGERGLPQRGQGGLRILRLQTTANTCESDQGSGHNSVPLHDSFTARPSST